MTQPDYFSALFWRNTVNHMIFGAATNALNAWILGGVGAIDKDAHLSIPGLVVLYAALSGALLGFLLSLLGQALPGTMTAAFVPPPAPKATARRRPARKTPAKTPAAAEVKKRGRSG